MNKLKIFPLIEFIIYFFIGIPILMSEPNLYWYWTLMSCIWAFGISTYHFTKKSELAGFLTMVARYYFLLAVPAKILLVIKFPELTTGRINIPDWVFITYTPIALITYLSGSFGVYLALIVLSFSSLLKKHRHHEPIKLRMPKNISYKKINSEQNILLIVILLIIVLKLFLIELYDFAKPGVIPKNLGIPGLTGLINTLIIHGVLLLSLILIIKESIHKNISLLYVSPALINIIIDLLNGYKFSLITITLVLIIINERQRIGSVIKKLPIPKNSIAQILIIFSGIFTYPILDTYSDIKGSGIDLDTSELISVVTLSPISSITETLRRINGLDSFIISHYLLGNPIYDWTVFFGTQAIEDLRYSIYGRNVDDVVSALGSTIFNPAILLGNQLYVTISLFLITIFFTIITNILFKLVQSDQVVYEIMYGFLAIEFSRVFFSAGDLLGNLKIIITYFIIAYIWLVLTRIRFNTSHIEIKAKVQSDEQKNFN